ncbi:plasmid partitioning protein, partial [Mesorhizobium sp. M00.F.Ca.ET.149.01.1.1]
AGRAIGADGFLANMGTEDFLSCLSRPALEASCADTPVLPRARVKDTRAALVDHYKEGHFVHPSALFAPDAVVLSEWLAKSAVTEVEDEDAPDDEGVAGEDQAAEGDATDEFDEGYREAAE